jgi:hypothetical protein
LKLNSPLQPLEITTRIFSEEGYSFPPIKYRHRYLCNTVNEYSVNELEGNMSSSHVTNPVSYKCIMRLYLNIYYLTSASTVTVITFTTILFFTSCTVTVIASATGLFATHGTVTCLCCIVLLVGSSVKLSPCPYHSSTSFSFSLQ